MGFCVYFHRTWTPGYNSEYIDPNLAFSFQRKLKMAKKIAWWVFVLTLLSCLVLLLVKLYRSSSSDCELPINSPTVSVNSSTEQLFDAVSEPQLQIAGIHSSSNSKIERAAISTTSRPKTSSSLCGNGSYICDRNSTLELECVNMTLVCDSIEDCGNGRDEAFCTAVSTNLHRVVMNLANDELEGYAIIRVKGSWHPYCSNNWTLELAQKICRHLNYEDVTELTTVGLSELNKSMGYNTKGRGKSSLERGRPERFPLWILGAGNNYSSTMTSGPIEDVVTESSGSDEHNCEVGRIICSRKSSSLV